MSATASTATFASRDGTPIGCTISGSGPPLVLVHGVSADQSRWAPVLSALGERCTVHACDRRGRGHSGDASTYHIEREFEDISAVVDGIGGPVDLLGHSYGGIVALEAALHAAGVRRIVLYEPPVPTGEPIYPPGVIERLERLLESGARDELIQTFLSEVPRVPPETLTRMRASPSWQARIAAAHTIPRELRAHESYQFVPEKFAAIAAPALLLLGGESPPSARVSLERVQAAVPHARLAILPGQRHTAMDTAPDLFAREVLAFLSP